MGGNQTDRVHSIILDRENNIYVTGFSMSSGGVEHYLTLKLNSFGDTIWTRTYSNGYCSAFCINLDNSESVYVTGGCDNSGNGTIATIKYSQLTGTLINEIKSENEYIVNQLSKSI